MFGTFICNSVTESYTVQRSISAQRKNLKIAQILNTQNMHLSADSRRIMNCRELMIAVNLDNIIAILVLGKNTSRAQNFLHNAALFLLICAMLQYSLVNQKKKTCFKDLANHQSKTQLEPIEKCLNGHMKISIMLPPLILRSSSSVLESERSFVKSKSKLTRISLIRQISDRE
jgi:hypothetical protein